MRRQTTTLTPVIEAYLPVLKVMCVWLDQRNLRHSSICMKYVIILKHFKASAGAHHNVYVCTCANTCVLRYVDAYNSESIHPMHCFNTSLRQNDSICKWSHRQPHVGRSSSARDVLWTWSKALLKDICHPCQALPHPLDRRLCFVKQQVGSCRRCVRGCQSCFSLQRSRLLPFNVENLNASPLFSVD